VPRNAVLPHASCVRVRSNKRKEHNQAILSRPAPGQGFFYFRDPFSPGTYMYIAIRYPARRKTDGIWSGGIRL